MNRIDSILTYIEKEHRGIEIGPWFAPLAPKSNGFNCLTLDVFDKSTLVANAIGDPNIPKDQIPNIQDVDLLGSSTDIEQLVSLRGELGQFDYIVSSHNFEHLPDPIKFLQGCGRVLKQGGILSMAIPDRRVCFDFFRPSSTLAQWIEAHFEKRVRPNYMQIFEHATLTAEFIPQAPWNSRRSTGLKASYDKWIKNIQNQSTIYHDTHCSTFTPKSFELLITDAHFLGMSPFQIFDISKTEGNEFHVHLRNVGCDGLKIDENEEAHVAKRQRLLSDLAQEPQYILPPEPEPKRKPKLRHKIKAWIRGR